MARKVLRFQLGGGSGYGFDRLEAAVQVFFGGELQTLHWVVREIHVLWVVIARAFSTTVHVPVTLWVRW